MRAILSLVALLGLSLGTMSATPAAAQANAAPEAQAAEMANVTVFGPYATLRQARAVESDLRDAGYSTRVYVSNGGYFYVAAW